MKSQDKQAQDNLREAFRAHFEDKVNLFEKQRFHKASLNQTILFCKEGERLLEKLIDVYPNCFSTDSFKPLKEGILDDLFQQQDRHGLTKRQIKHVLRYYTHREAYLKALVVGQTRVDLAGQRAGEVAEKQAEASQKTLALDETKRFGVGRFVSDNLHHYRMERKVVRIAYDRERRKIKEQKRLERLAELRKIRIKKKLKIKAKQKKLQELEGQYNPAAVKKRNEYLEEICQLRHGLALEKWLPVSRKEFSLLSDNDQRHVKEAIQNFLSAWLNWSQVNPQAANQFIAKKKTFKFWLKQFGDME